MLVNSRITEFCKEDKLKEQVQEMPKKVPFRVVYSTGWEDDYPPKDLEVHSPFVKGWRSPRYCLYPQELVLRLDPPTRVRKLQLLSHQYMIACKIDLYVGQLPSDTHTSIEHAQFKRLGYISLSDNEQTGYRSRELKSVNLDCHGHLIKLVLQANHINRLNLFNQVSLVALNVIGDQDSVPRVGVSSSLPTHISHYTSKARGDPLSDVIHSYLPSVHHSQDNPVDPVLMGTINKPSHVPLMDDLGFAVAQDPQTADLIRELDAKKRIAVRDEEYQYAKQLKLVIDELQKIGEVLCRYEVEKKLAIEREDYDTAKQKKAHLDAIRKQVYDQLNIQGLLNSSTASTTEVSTYSHQERSHPRVKRVTPFDTDYSSRGPPGSAAVSHTPLTLPPIDHHGVVEHTSPHRAQYTEDRPLPALVAKAEKLETVHEAEADVSGGHKVSGASKGGGAGEGGGESEGMQPGDPPDRPEPMTAEQLNKLPFALDIFGMEVLEHIYSKQYFFREKGVQQVLASLEGQDEGGRKETSSQVKATCEVLNKVLNDKIMSTFGAGLELLNYLVGPFAQKHRLGRPDLTHIVEKVMPLLLNRAGDTTPRIIAAANDQITALADHQQIKTFGIIGPMLVRPFKQKKPPWRLAQSRVELLDRLYRGVGFQTSGINYRTVMEFLSPLLSHPHGNVREPAIKLVLDLYREYGNDIRQLLPVPDDQASRRKTLWKSIFEGFDRIDGVPTQAEKEATRAAAERAKNKEIQKLREEMETLQQLAAQGNVKDKDTESTVDQSTACEAPTLSEAPTLNEPPTVDEIQSVNEDTTRASRDSRTSNTDTIDMTCVFCGDQRREFADKGMESHYLQHCPMLQSCPYCSQVIEISGLTKHWLTECEAKAKFKECPNCSQAVLAKQYDSHVTSCRGRSLGSGHALCPLCHTSVQDGEESWRSHLMGNGPRACQKNPRRKAPPAKRPPAKKGGPSTGAARGTNIPRPGVKGIRKNRTK